MTSLRALRYFAPILLAGAGTAACTDRSVTAPDDGPTAADVRARLDALVPPLVDGIDAAQAQAAVDPTSFARAQGIGGLLAGGPAATPGARAPTDGVRAPASDRFAGLLGGVLGGPAGGSPADGARARGIGGRLASSSAPDARGLVRAVDRGLRLFAGDDASSGMDAIERGPRLGQPGAVDRDPGLDRARVPSRGVAVARWLDDHVFADDNFDGGVFALPPDLVCASDAGVVDPACAKAVVDARLAIEPALQSPHGLDLTLVTGPDRTPVLTIDLDPQVALATIDLGALDPVLTALGGGAVQGAPALDLSGAIEAGVSIYGTGDVGFEAGAITPIHVGLAAAPGGPELALDLAAAAPAFALHLDGPEQTTTLTTQLGELQLTVPADDASRAPAVLDVPAIQLVASQTAGQPLVINGLSLGNRATELRIDGRPALTLDLNPDDRNRVGLTIDREADTGATILEVDPRLDLRLAVDWAALGQDVPAVAVTRVLLDAADHQHGAVRLSTDDSGARVTEVVGGSLTIETDPSDAGGTFEAGQCVARTEAGGFQAVDCP
jgi:hypothetical protein